MARNSGPAAVVQLSRASCPNRVAARICLPPAATLAARTRLSRVEKPAPRQTPRVAPLPDPAPPGKRSVRIHAPRAKRLRFPIP